MWRITDKRKMDFDGSTLHNKRTGYSVSVCWYIAICTSAFVDGAESTTQSEKLSTHNERSMQKCFWNIFTTIVRDTFSVSTEKICHFSGSWEKITIQYRTNCTLLFWTFSIYIVLRKSGWNFTFSLVSRAFQPNSSSSYRRKGQVTKLNSSLAVALDRFHQSVFYTDGTFVSINSCFGTVVIETTHIDTFVCPKRDVLFLCLSRSYPSKYRWNVHKTRLFFYAVKGTVGAAGRLQHQFGRGHGPAQRLRDRGTSGAPGVQVDRTVQRHRPVPVGLRRRVLVIRPASLPEHGVNTWPHGADSHRLGNHRSRLDNTGWVG